MSEKSFRKGDMVEFSLGTRPVQGEIVEDRGPIGIKGRHLYLVKFHRDSHPVVFSQIELPAEELQAVQGVGTRE